jgi:sulfatase maturation enzyme AslB (radical SAM superfamily)
VAALARANASRPIRRASLAKDVRVLFDALRRRGFVTHERCSLPTPRSLLCELTYRCNLQCPYCYNPLDLGRIATS